jgi:hypothetical protein
MLTDFDETLKQMLQKRVPLDPNAVDVSFECPSRAWSARVLKPTVSLYLFDLRENKPAKQSGTGPAPVAPTMIDLSYFITAWAPTVAEEHQLLWRVMMTLMRTPQIPIDLLQGELKKSGPPTKTTTAQWDGVLKKPGELWEAVDNVIKPAVTYTATLPITVIPPPPARPPVLTKMIVTESVQRTQREPLIAIGGIVRTRPVGEPGAEGARPQRAVANAEVIFPALGIAVRSDGDGRYVVPRIPQGTHRVQVITIAGDVAAAEITVPAPNYNLEV